MRPKRFQQVKDYIIDGLQQGRWRVNDRIPSENDLVRHCGVSRMTARRALLELTEAGFLTRTQGLGTFVADRRAASSLFEIRDIADDIAALGHQHRAEVLGLDHAALPAHAFAGCDDYRALECHHSRLLHYADTRPVQLEIRWVNATLIPNYGRQNFALETPAAYLLRHLPVTRAEQSVEATLMTTAHAVTLKIEPGTPCLVVRRVTWSAECWATYTTFYHPGEHFRLFGNIRHEELT